MQSCTLFTLRKHFTEFLQLGQLIIQDLAKAKNSDVAEGLAAASVRNEGKNVSNEADKNVGQEISEPNEVSARFKWTSSIGTHWFWFNNLYFWQKGAGRMRVAPLGTMHYISLISNQFMFFLCAQTPTCTGDRKKVCVHQNLSNKSQFSQHVCKLLLLHAPHCIIATRILIKRNSRPEILAASQIANPNHQFCKAEKVHKKHIRAI